MWGDGSGATERARTDVDATSKAELFRRRLAEAHALGAASNALPDASPHLSARVSLTPGQMAGGQALLGAACVFMMLEPGALANVCVAIATGVFAIMITIRIAAAIAALLPRSAHEVIVRDDDILPVLTILAPLYREANVVDQLIGALHALDYPSRRLDIKLIVEADDLETLSALAVTNLPDWMEVVPVPPSLPRTKPKALNYGLAFARGDVVAIFDAEDLPSPAQPREAVAALYAAPDIAVVQAPLLAHNGRQGWLAGQFQLEYAIQFLVWLPFLARLGTPLPLGGTSNYFRREDLDAAGGWDAWNVTEDADLGLRIARRGKRAVIISEPTLEEAPVRFADWRAQRTRWMKGYIQTWLVLMRSPLALLRELGPGRFIGLQITLGGALMAALLHGPLMAWIALGVLTPFVEVEGWHATLLGAGYGSVLAAALASGVRLRLSSVLSVPFYWPLLSITMISALWELRRRPHFWAKTPHGVRTSHVRLEANQLY